MNLLKFCPILSIKFQGFNDKLWCATNWHWFVVDANFCGVNNLTLADFQLARWHQPAHTILENSTTSSYGPYIIVNKPPCPLFWEEQDLNSKGAERLTYELGSMPGYWEKSVWASENCRRSALKCWSHTENGASAGESSCLYTCRRTHSDTRELDGQLKLFPVEKSLFPSARWKKVWESGGAGYYVSWSLSYLAFPLVTKINFLFWAGICFPRDIHSFLVAISWRCWCSNFTVFVKLVSEHA